MLIAFACMCFIFIHTSKGREPYLVGLHYIQCYAISVWINLMDTTTPTLFIFSPSLLHFLQAKNQPQPKRTRHYEEIKERRRDAQNHHVSWTAQVSSVRERESSMHPYGSFACLTQIVCQGQTDTKARSFYAGNVGEKKYQKSRTRFDLFKEVPFFFLVGQL